MKIISTARFRALSDQVDEYRKNERVLIRTLAMLVDDRPDLQPQAPERPQLRVIKGGRQ